MPQANTPVVRVVITDDSPIATDLLRDVLGRQPGIAVVGTARSASELSVLVATLNPDVVTLDLLMPDRSGLALVRDLASVTQVLVVSDHEANSALARESLMQGAQAFFSKRELGTAHGQANLIQAVLRHARTSRPAHVVAIAGSTGAMPALEGLVPQLAGAHAAFVVLQHLPAERMAAFSEWLTSLGLPAQLAEHGQLLREGAALVAPGDKHLRVVRGERVEFDYSPPLAGHRPSATVLFASLTGCAAQATAVVLSGMGRDGADGLASFVAAGGKLIVQRPDTCAVPGMPEAALALSPRAHRLSPAEIGMLVRGRAAARRHD